MGNYYREVAERCHKVYGDWDECPEEPQSKTFLSNEEIRMRKRAERERQEYLDNKVRTIAAAAMKARAHLEMAWREPDDAEAAMRWITGTAIRVYDYCEFMKIDVDENMTMMFRNDNLWLCDKIIWGALDYAMTEKRDDRIFSGIVIYCAYIVHRLDSKCDLYSEITAGLDDIELRRKPNFETTIL